MHTGEEVNSEVAHGLEVIERNAKAQSKLIEDLLDVSRISTGKLRMTPRLLALSPVPAEGAGGAGGAPPARYRAPLFRNSAATSHLAD